MFTGHEGMVTGFGEASESLRSAGYRQPNDRRGCSHPADLGRLSLRVWWPAFRRLRAIGVAKVTFRAP